MPKKFLLSLAAFAAAFSLAACGSNGDNAEEDGTAQSEQQGETALPEPELDDIPDVVATVNDQEISGEDFSQSYEAQFQQLALQSQMTGQEVDQDLMKTQILDMMINSTLLVLDAEDQGFSTSDAQVDEYLTALAQDNGLESQDALLEEFEAQGISEDRVRHDIHQELLIEQVFETLDVAEPTEEELQTLYDQQVQQIEAMNEQLPEDQAQDVPSFEDVEAELVQQAEQQQGNAALTVYIEELREQAQVETHL